MTDTPLATYISVDIWSDIACPWCYIGKRRFEKALAEFETAPGAPNVKVTYHSYELSPDTPVDFEGSEVDFLVAHKGMAAEQVNEMLEQVTQIAAQEGLTYNFDALQHTNTMRAHELLHFAKSQGKQAELKERLLKAYFEQGRHVGDLDTLVELAADVGLERTEVLSALTTRKFAADVQADIAQAHGFGVSGVPFYVIDAKYGVSGAQEPSVFVSALTQAATDRGAPGAASAGQGAADPTPAEHSAASPATGPESDGNE